MTDTLHLAGFTTNTWPSPLAVLRISGPVEAAGFNLIHGSDGTGLYPKRASQADLIILQRDFPRHGSAYQKIWQISRDQGKPVIFDLDDLLLELPGDHPDRLNHYYAPALLPIIEAAASADAISTSSQPLVEYLRLINPQVTLLPNSLDDRFWKLKLPPQPDPSMAGVTIGYMGGDSHTSDLSAIAQALVNTSNRYPGRIKFHFMGASPPPLLADLPGVIWSPSTTFDYAHFAAAFQKHDFDLAIAPLRDDRFNRCKSSIKYLEYSACGIPGVYSSLEPYAVLVEHGINGFLASSQEEWEEQLARLIEDRELRYEMAVQAQKTVQKGWLLSQRAGLWRNFYQSVWSGGVVERHENQQPQALLEAARQMQAYQISLESVLERRSSNERELGPESEQAERAEQSLILIAQERDHLSSVLNDIYNSRAWKLIRLLWQIRQRIWPSRSSQLTPQPSQSENTFSSSAAIENQPEPAVQVEESLSAVPAPASYDVIVFPVMDWATRVQRPQQIAKQFALAGHRVFYLNTTINDGSGVHVKQVVPNIYEVQLTASAHQNIYKENMHPQIQQELANAFQELRIKNDIVEAVCLVDLPFWTPLVLELRQAYGWKIVYDCMDYHAGFTSNTQAMLSEEENLVRQSDLVLVSSHFLAREVSTRNSNFRLVPNGADYDHFRFPSLQIPDELVGLSKPIIGYYGAVADWIDTKLIANLAKARSGWSFVLIGDTQYADLNPLRGLSNVYLLGEKPYASLPPYLHAFDAAVIPFLKMPLTDATNPVKLFEYLSGGRAVVAAELDELRHYKEYTRLVSTQEEWLTALEEAQGDYSQASLERRFNFARQNTWQQRFLEINSAVQELSAKISIIVLTYNNLDYNRLCLNSIVEKTVYPNYELIVVDNASTDGTPEFLEEFAARHPHVRLVLNAANTGFARGNNIGAAEATGEILVFLNNDTVVTRGWLSGLARYLQDERIGLVGPVTNWSGNETCITVEYKTVREMDSFAQRYTSDHARQAFEVKMLPFLCVGLRRKVFEEVGPLDENFGLGMFEDDDYAVRLKEKGYKVLCAEDVFVHHWGKASFSKLDQDSYQRLFEENRRKFELKWGTWEPHQGR
jgi:GT2 family glycosyltransferase/glycosyltransferase involved in cell wall biosynthesis